MLGMNLVFLQMARECVSSIYSVFRNCNNIYNGRKGFSLEDILITEKNEISATYEEKITTSNKRMYPAGEQQWSLILQSGMVVISLFPYGKAQYHLLSRQSPFHDGLYIPSDCGSELSLFPLTHTRQFVIATRNLANLLDK